MSDATAGGALQPMVLRVHVTVRAARPTARRPAVIVPLVLAILAVLATDVYLLTQRSVVTPVGVDAALAEFRAGRPAAPATAPSPDPGASASGAPATVAAPAPVEAARAPAPLPPALGADDPAPALQHQPAPHQPGRQQTAPAAPPPPDAASPSSSSATALPAEGVYVYRATGGEQISVVGASHAYPERVTATVRHLGGCRWEHRNDVLREHVDVRVLCNHGGAFLQHEQLREVEFFGKRDSVHFRCEPPQVLWAPGDGAGATADARCGDGNGNEAQMRRTAVGFEQLTIGDRTVEAVHVHLDGTFTGKATGSSSDDLWLALDTGMTLRWDRTVDTLADAAFGAEVRYQEEGASCWSRWSPSRSARGRNAPGAS